MEKRTPAAWTEYLANEHAPVTITEYMAGCLSRILACSSETAQATAHVEGMVGAIDEMCSRMDANYQGDGQVRAALDAKRNEQRRLAAEDRQRMLERSA